jgi:hypothetical protein
MRPRISVLPAFMAVLLLAGIVAAAPASALTKETFIIPLDSVITFQAGDLCSFPVVYEQGPGLVKVQDFFDANGNIVEEIVTNYGGAFRATVSANGNTLTTVQTFSDMFTVNPDGSFQIADSGINFVFTLPGEGAVFLMVGKIVLDSNLNPVFLAGPGFRTDADIAALCAALSG